MAIGPFAVTIHRQEVVDFTTSFYQEPFSILIPSPTEEDRLWAVLRPFQLTVCEIRCILVNYKCINLNISTKYGVGFTHFGNVIFATSDLVEPQMGVGSLPE